MSPNSEKFTSIQARNAANMFQNAQYSQSPQYSQSLNTQNSQMQNVQYQPSIAVNGELFDALDALMKNSRGLAKVSKTLCDKEMVAYTKRVFNQRFFDELISFVGEVSPSDARRYNSVNAYLQRYVRVQNAPSSVWKGGAFGWLNLVGPICSLFMFAACVVVGYMSMSDVTGNGHEVVFEFQADLCGAAKRAFSGFQPDVVVPISNQQTLGAPRYGVTSNRAFAYRTNTYGGSAAVWSPTKRVVLVRGKNKKVWRNKLTHEERVKKMVTRNGKTSAQYLKI